eukprot:SAG11_NODE_907_length_6599_cov_13.219231_4_plen_63_part_00
MFTEQLCKHSVNMPGVPMIGTIVGFFKYRGTGIYVQLSGTNHRYGTSRYLSEYCIVNSYLPR